MAHLTMTFPGRFNATALYEAMDAQRRSRGQSWSQIAAELGISSSTLTRTSKGGRMEVGGMLAMVRWVGRTVESFVHESSTGANPSQTTQMLDAHDKMRKKRKQSGASRAVPFKSRLPLTEVQT